jgi:hypothetical protein
MKTLLLTIALLINVYSLTIAQAQTATKNSIDLRIDGSEECPVIMWTNKKEVNTGYYIIECSYDNVNFSTIANRKALGTSNFPANYVYSNLCKKPESTTYYRIVLVLMGGERIVSEAKTHMVVDSSINENVIANTIK